MKSLYDEKGALVFETAIYVLLIYTVAFTCFLAVIRLGNEEVKNTKPRVIYDGKRLWKTQSF